MIQSAYWKRLSLGMIGTVLLATTIGCAGGPLTTREQAAGIGAVGGAAAGGHRPGPVGGADRRQAGRGRIVARPLAQRARHLPRDREV